MSLPPTDRDVYCLKLTVSPADIDDLDHVNNVVYVSWVQDAAAAHWRKVASEALRNQCRWVVHRHEIDYVSSAVNGDVLEVYTWVDPPAGPRQARFASIQRSTDHKVLAHAKSTWVLLDPLTGKPKRISEEIVKVFQLKEGE